MPLSKDDLLGAWSLEEWYIESDDGGRSHPMGRDAEGVIMYTGDGYMSAIVHARNRRLPADRPSDTERLGAFASYVNYAGRWDVDGDAVIHTVEHALNPNMQGHTITRTVDHAGTRMTFTGATPGSPGAHVIVWKRS